MKQKSLKNKFENTTKQLFNSFKHLKSKFVFFGIDLFFLLILFLMILNWNNYATNLYNSRINNLDVSSFTTITSNTNFNELEKSSSIFLDFVINMVLVSLVFFLIEIIVYAFFQGLFWMLNNTNKKVNKKNNKKLFRNIDLKLWFKYSGLVMVWILILALPLAFVIFLSAILRNMVGLIIFLSSLLFVLHTFSYQGWYFFKTKQIFSSIKKSIRSFFTFNSLFLYVFLVTMFALLGFVSFLFGKYNHTTIRALVFFFVFSFILTWYKLSFSFFYDDKTR